MSKGDYDIGWSSDGAKWHSSDGDGLKMVIKCSNLEKKKEKQNPMEIKPKI